MSKKIVFDTLEYAKMLAEGGVEHADIHSSSLATALVQNIYTRDEVDKMIEETFKRFDDRTFALEARIKDLQYRTDQKIFALDKRLEISVKELENRIDQRFVHHMHMTISILGTLIVIVGAVSTFAHYFIH